MTTELTPTGNDENRKIRVRYHGGSSETVYGLGLIGAWVFYFKRVTTFQQGVQAFFKGLFWPAFLVYALLVFLEKE